MIMTCISDRRHGLPLLIKFLDTEKSLENIEMWLDMDEIMKRVGNWSAATKLINITMLYSKYLAETSVKEVNVGAEMKKAMTELVNGDWVREGTENMLRPEVILMQLKAQVMLNLLDTWSRFKETKHYELYRLLATADD
jgi:hypothetical protein